MCLIFPKPLKLQQLTRYNTILSKGQRVCICLPLPLHLPLTFMDLLIYPTVYHFPSKHRNEVKITDGKGSEIHPLLKSEMQGLAPAHSPKPAPLVSRKSQVFLVSSTASYSILLPSEPLSAPFCSFPYSRPLNHRLAQP